MSEAREISILRLAVRCYRLNHRIGELAGRAPPALPLALLPRRPQKVHGDCDEVTCGAIRPDPGERLPDAYERGLSQVFGGVSVVHLTRKEPDEPRPQLREQGVERTPSAPLRTAHEGA